MSWRSSRTEAPAEPVVAGRVRRTHGLRGEVLVEVLSVAPERFAAGAQLWFEPTATSPEGAAGRWLTVESSRPGPGSAGRLVRFVAFTNPEEAALLRGGWLEVDRGDVAPAPAGSFYPHELVGARCVDEKAGDLGVIEGLIDAGGGPLLVVRAGERELLVPFVESFVRGLDRAGRRLAVRLPAGLVED